MSRAVLISIRPKWCAKIASGEKTIEVRKTRPKIETPFKCYIYQTLPKSGDWNNRDGHVIGELVCDKIWELAPICHAPDNTEEMACMSRNEIVSYLNKCVGFGWHISDLKIYDEPKELAAFKRPCNTEQPCALCRHAELHPDGMLMCENRVFSPPQSWCYVEEVSGDA